MIVDQRIYDIEPQSLSVFLSNYERNGLEVQRKILGGLIGYFTTDVGGIRSVTHMWAYSSMEDRSRRRRRLYESKEWLAHVKENSRYILRMRNRVLLPTRFSPGLQRFLRAE